MMHGKFTSTLESDDAALSIWGRLVLFVRQRKWIVVVILPTLLATIYYGLIAAPQYESEAHFMVRSTGGSMSALSSGATSALSLLGGSSNTSSDTASVSDYLSSHDAVDTLRSKDDLVGIYTRPGVDFFSRLYPGNPTPERLASYFRGKSSVKLDDASGITTIRVRSFRPEDSYRLVNSMLDLGEQRVNVLNKRAYESSLAMARRQLAEAENAIAQAQAATTRFRQGRHNIDPVATGQAQIQVVSGLQAMLAQARAQRAAMTGSIGPSSPQARAMDARIAALEGQVASESARLTGSSTAIAANVGDYQGLQLRQQFASKRYDDAAASLQRAREQAAKQQLFIVRVVQPNLPVKATYPKGFRIVATIFIGLTLIYACGWLIAAGVREHSA
jgi:capsular polysaccharide transport system permease protein